MLGPVAVAVVVVAAVVGFVIGSVNPAYLIGRALGRDVRTAGSGNPGATNAGRLLGPRWGVVVGCLDVAKGFVPTAVVLAVAGLLPGLACGLAAVLGHMFSPWLGGRGGKGVATALGALLAVAPWVALGAVVVFGLALGIVRVVGLASVLTAVGLVLVGLLAASKVWEPVVPVVGTWMVALGALVMARHHRNLRQGWTGRHPR